MLNDYKMIKKHEHKIIKIKKLAPQKRDKNTALTWNELESRVFKRDGYRCRKCGNKYHLIVHHKKPQSKYPDLVFKLTNCITLCRHCHYQEHKLWLDSKALTDEYYNICNLKESV